MTTPWQLHVERWHNCQQCHLAEGRVNVVLGRGVLPAHILFVGEAPGESEDTIGAPFVGPAGEMLTDWIDSAGGNQYRLAFTNLVCCIPLAELDPVTGSGKRAKQGEPDDDAIEACMPRLREFIKIADNYSSLNKVVDSNNGTLKLIVAVGRLAKDFLDPGYKHGVKLHRKIPQCHIIHPAAVLRANYATKSLLRQQAIMNLASALEDVK